MLIQNQVKLGSSATYPLPVLRISDKLQKYQSLGGGIRCPRGVTCLYFSRSLWHIPSSDGRKWNTQNEVSLRDVLSWGWLWLLSVSFISSWLPGPLTGKKGVENSGFFIVWPHTKALLLLKPKGTNQFPWPPKTLCGLLSGYQKE